MSCQVVNVIEGRNGRHLAITQCGAVIEVPTNGADIYHTCHERSRVATPHQSEDQREMQAEVRETAVAFVYGIVRRAFAIAGVRGQPMADVDREELKAALATALAEQRGTE